jgi:hypothetical protein
MHAHVANRAKKEEGKKKEQHFPLKNQFDQKYIIEVLGIPFTQIQRAAQVCYLPKRLP